VECSRVLGLVSLTFLTLLVSCALLSSLSPVVLPVLYVLVVVEKYWSPWVVPDVEQVSPRICVKGTATLDSTLLPQTLTGCTWVLGYQVICNIWLR
jgi:hypothetical protein